MENLRCPYCGGEMQKGWLRSRRLGGHHPAPAAYPAPACAGLFSLPQPYRSCFALRRDPLLPPSAKVGKNAVQTCGLKIRSRPAHGILAFCIPRAVDLL